MSVPLRAEDRQNDSEADTYKVEHWIPESGVQKALLCLSPHSREMGREGHCCHCWPVVAEVLESTKELVEMQVLCGMRAGSVSTSMIPNTRVKSWVWQHRDLRIPG